MESLFLKNCLLHDIPFFFWVLTPTLIESYACSVENNAHY